MLQEFLDYLESHVNKGIYVWGAQGQTASEAFIIRHETGRDETRALNLYRKRLRAGVNPDEILAFDCSGFGMYWLHNLKNLYPTDKNANGMYGSCTPIKKAELKKGDWVFRGGTGRKYHIGYVTEIRNGIPWVVECKGRDDGVIKGPIKGTYWNAFGRPRIFKDEIEGEDIKLTRELYVITPFMQGADVVKVQTALAYFGFFKGAIKGHYGPITRRAVIAYQKTAFPNDRDEWDGIVGKQTWTKLFG